MALTAFTAWEEAFLSHNPGSVRREDMVHLVQSASFMEFLHMLLEVKQGYYLQLAGIALSTPDGVHAASQLQGRVAALDSLRDFVQDILEVKDDERT